MIIRSAPLAPVSQREPRGSKMVIAQTETAAKATEAWWAMFHELHPLPAGMAIDMVQDVCGERDDAVIALLESAWQWLVDLCPERPDSVPTSTEGRLAIAVRGHILCEGYGIANNCRLELLGMHARIVAGGGPAVAGWVELEEATNHLAPRNMNDDISLAWYHWARWHVPSAIVRCRAISEAA